MQKQVKGRERKFDIISREFWVAHKYQKDVFDLETSMATATPSLPLH